MNSNDFPLAGSHVSGLRVRNTISNLDSIPATFSDYKILDGIRELSLKEWGSKPSDVFYSKTDIERSKKLAEEIKRSGEITPLIVSLEDGEPYILEGLHRLAALMMIPEVDSFPALVVEDLG